MRLAQLLDMSVVQRLAEANYTANGMPIGIVDAIDGSILAACGWQEICAKFHRAHPLSLQRCRDSEHDIARHISESAPCEYKCKNGLRELAIPIVVAGERLAALLLGQFFYEGESPDREFFVQQARRFGYDEQAYLAALERVPVFSRRVVENILAYDRALARLIADLAEGALRHLEDQQAIQATEALFRAIFEQAAVGMAQVEPRTGRFLHVNDRLCRILGYSHEEMLSRRWEDLTYPEDLPQDRESHARMLATRESYSKEKRFVRKDGKPVWVNVAVAPMGPGGGEPTSHVSVVEDITASKLAEEALRESEERFRIAFHTSPDSIHINRLEDGLFVAVNDGFTRITGWGESEVLGRSSLDLPIWDDPADRARLVAHLKKDGFAQNLEARFRRKDGTVLSGLMSARLIRLRGEAYLLSITRDVSDWKRAEEERDRLRSGLHQAAKMEAVGQLAGGVAHDFNNLLTVILSGAEALRHGLANGSPPDPEVVDEIAGAGARARDLTRQLLAFARRQVFAPVPLDLNALILDVEKLLRRVLGENIELVTNLQPALWPVRCDPGQIEQVILNLAVNARDAMPEGGKLTIETSNENVTGVHALLYPGIDPGPHVRLAVHDSGVGMTPAIRTRLFEPLFTTKPLGKGTGLGLATVHGIVKQSGGHIRVETEPTYGTTFEVLFPRTAEAAGRSAETGTAEQTKARRSATVLLVEDDPHVRSATARALISAGHTVLLASNGLEAIEVLASHRGGLDLLVTDVIMPGVDGRKLAEAVRKEWPNVRVLFVSGHAHDVLGQHGLLDEGVDLLAKPYTSASLLERVTSALGQSPRSPEGFDVPVGA